MENPGLEEKKWKNGIKMIIEALEGKRDLNKVLELIEVAEIFESIGTKKYPPLIEPYLLP